MSGTENRNKPGLTTMIFIALLLGAAAGALLHAFAAVCSMWLGRALSA